VVIAVSVAGSSYPAVLGGVGVQVPERVGEGMPGGEGAVEVVFLRGEERVARLVVGFEDVQVPEKYRRVSRFPGGHCRLACGEPLPLALGLLWPAVAGRHVGADDLDGTGRGGEKDRGGAGRQVPEPLAELASRCLDPGDDHDAVPSGLGHREADVPPGRCEGTGQEAAAGAGFRLGEDEDMLGPAGEPLQLSFGTLFRRVADIKMSAMTGCWLS
jgi:hypothetical protein